MASYYKELTDESEIVRFRRAGLCYFRDGCRHRLHQHPPERESVWILLPPEVLYEAKIARNMRQGYKYAILAEDEDE